MARCAEANVVLIPSGAQAAILVAISMPVSRAFSAVGAISWTTPMRKACSAVAEVKEPNALIDRLAELHGEVWTVNGKQEERISVADIRDHLGLAVVDLVRFQSIGPRIAEAMMALGWTQAKKNLRS